MNLLPQLLFSGVSVGAIYALIALGFVITFKASEVLNFAHGTLLVAGAYVMALLVMSGFGFWLALGAGVLFMVILMLGIERALVRPMLGRRNQLHAIAVMTIGVDMIGRTELARRLKTDILPLNDPWGTDVIAPLGITIPTARLAAMIAVGILLTGFFAWFKLSRWGVALRAAAEDREAATLAGIPLAQVSAVSWGLAGGLAAVAGAFLATFPSPGVSTDLGVTAFRAFPAAILGGLDSTLGAVVGGLIIGVTEQLTQGYGYQVAFLGSGLHEVMAYVVMIVVLLVRPTGLFGSRDLTRV